MAGIPHAYFLGLLRIVFGIKRREYNSHVYKRSIHLDLYRTKLSVHNNAGPNSSAYRTPLFLKLLLNLELLSVQPNEADLKTPPQQLLLLPPQDPSQSAVELCNVQL